MPEDRRQKIDSKKQSVSVLCSLLSVICHLSSVFCLATAAPWPTTETRARQAILVDYASGTVLLEKEAAQLTTPSSMTKMMTTYLIFKKLKAGQITEQTQLPVSEAAWRMGGSKMFVRVGDQVSLHDLLRGIIIQSGNDACIVVAEGLSGTIAAFSKEMTAEAHRLGATQTTFKNPHGWPEEGHQTTVRDLAILARHLIAEFPEYYGLHAEQEFTYNNIRQPNRNPLLGKNIGGIGIKADGIKTGHTDLGGYGLVASAEHEGQRLILVVNGLASERERAEESFQLIAWAMQTFGSYRFFKAGEAVVSIPVAMGDTTSVNAMTNQDIALAIPREWRSQVKVELIRAKFIKAPIQQGDVIGQVVVTTTEGQEPKAFPLVAARDVGVGGFFGRLRDSVLLLLRGYI
jgi:D-alanyl-D-alanine carboxypeptidase (penicillin-binding protein 5/6)